MSPTRAIWLLLLLLGAAYTYNQHAGAIASYTGHPFSGTWDAPGVIWSQQLDLQPGETIVALGGLAQRIVVASASPDSNSLTARWYDHSGYTTGMKTWEHMPPAWAVAGDSLITVDGGGPDESWQVNFVVPGTGSGDEGNADFAGSLTLAGEFYDINIVPVYPDSVVILAYGDAQDPTGELVDQVFFYHRDYPPREQAGAAGTAADHWQQAWMLAYRDQPVLHVAPNGPALVFTLYEAGKSEPYRLELRDHRGKMVWARPLEAPGWLATFSGKDAPFTAAGITVWARKEKEIALLGRDENLWTLELEGVVEDCWPLDPSFSRTGCVVQAGPGGERELITLNRLGTVVRRLPMAAGTQWWRVFPAGLLLGEGSTIRSVDPMGKVGWTLTLPFTPQLVATIDDGLVLAGQSSIALVGVSGK